MNDQIENYISIDSASDRPLVTFALFAYNQEIYVREAIESAFAQTYEPLEILIFDDCSTDGTPRVIEEVIRSSKNHRQVYFYKSDSNQGLASQINWAMRVASGRLIVVAAGDDVSVENRVQRITDYWVANGSRSGSIFSSYETIDAEGVINKNLSPCELIDTTVHDRKTEVLRWLSVGTQGCAHAWTKDSFDYFGPLDGELIHEDISIPLRSLMLGSVAFLPDKLVLYRIACGSQSRIGFHGAQDRMKKMARYWKGRVANYRQFDKDLNLALKDNILSKSEFNWMDEVVGHQRSIAQFCCRFFSSGPVERLALVANFSIRVPVLLRAKMAVLALFPVLYRFRLGSGSS
jgi:glycosyltransferase involved in cell wall biosynthesis